ncbi:transmembrane amino acid transporter protein-domain-containing protein [Sphaerosporella brunnea]|uniref:Transmembrane amino acid transporter protein-domain-containing protein n=1 Tax=Sphaerosporella brunnea TaxID=1250544 RepID=A0A5J5ELU5_9PEZI|nr:transmembrane amino acid transporter protein-domain-containing protein [Sphaerosporella brunnea]
MSDSGSWNSKTPKAGDALSRYYNNNYSDADTDSEHCISPSAQISGISIPSSTPRASGSVLRQRRPSITLGLEQLRHVGGPNSIDAFARSWQRAAGYFEIAPSRQSYVSVSDHGDHDDVESRAESALFDDESEHAPSEYSHIHTSQYGSYGSFSQHSRGSIPVEGFASLRSAMPAEGLGGLSGSVIRHAEDLLQEQEQALLDPGSTDKEREPLLLKTVETEGGVIQTVIVGQSTLPQTVFNSVNLLVGIGLLSLPLGLKYSGWVIGMPFLALSALCTNYSAKLLARCLERSPNKALVSYSDIAYIAFGQKARVFVSILFSLELMGACVALVVLFADSLHILIPSVSELTWKIFAGVILTPLSFLPLRVLSFSSILGIMSTVSIFLIVLINGLIKPDFPGSLRDPAPTYAFPQNWMTLPVSFGLLMSPWGGHGVFPNIYKDMRHPYKYNRAVNITYWLTYLLDASMMAVGILMFGDGVMDEITANVLELTGYPESAKVAMVVFISIIPLTKSPLNARPIITTLDLLLGVEARASLSEDASSAFSTNVIRALIRVISNIVFVVIAIVCPGYDRIMAFMGSALCFAICVVLPVLFYLKIFGEEVSTRERVLDWFLIVVGTVLAVVGTAFTFFPAESFEGGA